MTKLLISGIPPETTELDLARLFFTFGQINTIEIVHDKRTRQPKGLAFVELHNEEAALDAVENLNNTVFGEGKLLVKVAHDKPAVPKPESQLSMARYVRVQKPDAAQQKKKRPRINR